jgi:hypothetical protein
MGSDMQKLSEYSDVNILICSLSNKKYNDLTGSVTLKNLGIGGYTKFRIKDNILYFGTKVPKIKDGVVSIFTSIFEINDLNCDFPLEKLNKDIKTPSSNRQVFIDAFSEKSPFYDNLISKYSSKCQKEQNSESSLKINFLDFGQGYVKIENLIFLDENCNYEKGYLSMSHYIHLSDVKESLQDESQYKTLASQHIVHNGLILELKTNNESIASDYRGTGNCGKLEAKKNPLLLNEKCLEYDLGRYKKFIWSQGHLGKFFKYSEVIDALVLCQKTSPDLCKDDMNESNGLGLFYRE